MSSLFRLSPDYTLWKLSFGDVLSLLELHNQRQRKANATGADESIPVVDLDNDDALPTEDELRSMGFMLGG